MQLTQRKSTFDLQVLCGGVAFSGLFATMLIVTVLCLLVNERVNEESIAEAQLKSAESVNADLQSTNQRLVLHSERLAGRVSNLQDQIRSEEARRSNARLIGTTVRPQMFFMQYVKSNGDTTFVPLRADHGLHQSLANDNRQQLSQEQRNLLKRLREEYSRQRGYSAREFSRLLSALSLYRSAQGGDEMVMATHVKLCSSYFSSAVNHEDGRYYTGSRAQQIRQWIHDDRRIDQLCRPEPRDATGSTPSLAMQVRTDRQAVEINGVMLSADDLCLFLSSFNGALELDLGSSAEPPAWLQERVLKRVGNWHRAESIGSVPANDQQTT